MAVSFLILLLSAFLHLSFSSAENYHTLVKSEFPLDDLEQVDRRGTVFHVPLVPIDDDIRIPDPQYGLKIIKVNRKRVGAEYKDSQAEDVREDFIRSGKIDRPNQEGRYDKPTKIRYTYALPDRAKDEKKDEKTQQVSNKHNNGSAFDLPQKEIKKTFSPSKANVDVSSQKKSSAKTEEEKDGKSEASSAANATSAASSAADSSDKQEKKKEKDKPSKVELNLVVTKPEGHEYHPHYFREHLFSPQIATNYNLLKHIYNRFLVGDVSSYLPQYFAPNQFEPSPNVVNIYYDKRYMQNAPGSHSFISNRGLGYKTNDYIPEHILKEIPHHDFFYLNGQPQFSPVVPDEYQIPHTSLPELHELHLKEPVEFQPVQPSLSIGKEIGDAYFLPKNEAEVKFDQRIGNPAKVPHPIYGLPDITSHSSFVQDCELNCPPHAPGLEFGVPLLDVSKVKLPTSYEVPLY